MTRFLALAVPALWAGTALVAVRLPAAITARGLRGRALGVLALIAVAATVTVLGVRLLPLAALVSVGAAAVALLTAPALVRLRRAARGIAAAGSATPAPPALRAAAARPGIAIPVQGTAYAALAGLVVTWTTVAPRTTLLPVTLATAVGWGWAVLRQPGALAHRPPCHLVQRGFAAAGTSPPR
jgi:hypothetical protein